MTGQRGFDAAGYWEERLAKNWGLNGVGYLGLGEGYNEALYLVKGAVFRRTVKSLDIDLSRARILDIGSGTGFALKQWRELGADEIVGSDIATFAVDQLQREFPGIEILQFDVGSRLAGDADRETFDCISAMDVLYHIVDDDACRRALRNIGRLLNPGGYFVVADNFVHGQTQRGQHQVSRSLGTLLDWLAAADLHMERRVPQYVLMNAPVDSQSRFLHWWWEKLVKQVRRSPHRSLFAGRVLVPLELALTRFVREGPTTEVAVCRKLGTVADGFGLP